MDENKRKNEEAQENDRKRIMQQRSFNLIFQQLDLDYYETDEPIIRIYGLTMNGINVLCHVHGFYPYFYIICSSEITSFKKDLNNAVFIESARENTVLDVQVVQKQNIYGYKENLTQDFLKITMISPKLIACARKILEKQYFTFESNIDFELRFMVDTNMVGCSWIELPPAKYHTRCSSDANCLEVDVFWNNLISHSPTEEEKWSRIAPFRILSFDIECAGRKGIFPEPNQDPVIQIANIVQKQGEKDPYIRNIFTLNTCDPIPGTTVLSFQDESDLLSEWIKFIHKINPDIITGYNIQNFDIPYLINRAAHLNIRSFPYLGKLKNVKTVIKDSLFQSKQVGNKQTKNINMEGRILFDLFQIILRNHKLRSYTLNSVSYHFLQEQKEDVHHSIITDLQNGTTQTRKRLAEYCLKDALLPLRLLEKLMCIINYIEMARVTGVPLKYLLTRGQQIKILSQLLSKAKGKNFVIPSMRCQQGDNYTGATVIEPCKGFYNVPIVTLDFASLYPSIMMAYNLCYSTLILPESFETLGDNDYIKTPSGNYFVKNEVKKGLLPEILENLIEARKKAKEDLKNETDPERKNVLDGRQLAIKITANSVYGFTGAQIGKLPCLEISQSVTAYGRSMIEKTKQLIEEKYKAANGYKATAKVIYGDTDSVMINFGIEDIREAMEMGRDAAKYVSSHFIPPIKLEFEKVYFPYLLINKKRYAGLYYTIPEKYDKMDCKGIETVRRDNCLLVAQVMETCLKKILIERNPTGAIKFVKETISDLMCNKIDISKLIITKEYTKAKYVGKQAHIELVRKMEQRDSGSAPKLGDRVPYVVVTGLKKSRIYSRSEDPLYALEHDIPIDVMYYLENQLSKPLLRIFEPILGSKTESIILKGEHTLTKKLTCPKVGIFANFIKKVDTCLECHSLLNDNNLAVCNHCKPKERELYLTKMNEMQVLEQKFSKLWTQCQRCQGSFHQTILCTNRDCPIFYMRIKVRKDLTTQEEMLKRFKW